MFLVFVPSREEEEEEDDEEEEEEDAAPPRAGSKAVTCSTSSAYLWSFKSFKMTSV